MLGKFQALLRHIYIIRRNNMTKLYIGNLSFQTTESELRDAFAKYTSITSVKLITDRDSGESRGFAFIEFGDSQEGSAAMNEMDGYSLGGKSLKVNEARPQAPRSSGGYGSGSSYRDEGRRNSRY
jgi:cold-inducible RNA-binding protein